MTDIDDIISRAPPHSVNAERSVIGALIMGTATAGASGLEADDFYLRDHRAVFQAIADLDAHRKTIDIVTVTDQLEITGQLEEAGGMHSFGVFHDWAASIKSFPAHVEIVRSHAKAREIRAMASLMMEATGDDWADVANEVMTAMLAQTRTTGKWDCDLKTAIQAGVNAIELAHETDGLVGVETGFAKLNELFGGFQRSDFVVIGARPAMGKTALLLNLAANAGCPVAIVSAEMPREQLALRMIANHGRVNAGNLRTAKMEDHEWAKVARSATDLKEKPMWILDKPAPSMAEVANFARRMKTQHGIKALYLDYLQRMRPRDVSRAKHEQIGEIAMGLKELARELDIPVIALAQVNREVEKRADSRPQMADLKHSGEIEQEADCVMLIYRDEVYNEDTADPGIAEIRIDKNRHGITGLVKLGWQGEFMRFSDFAPTVYQGGGY